MPEPPRIKIDMHTHCEYSPDSRTPIADQAAAIRAAGLDVVCATDHHTIEGALRLREVADGFRVIVGQEVSTREGELIGLFLERPIPRDRSAEETIALIHEQGGLVSVPHPFSQNRPQHLRRETLDRLWPQVDLLEVFNAREVHPNDNRKAATYAKERHIPAAAGSDAHRPEDLGLAYVECADFTDPESFLEAVRQGTIVGRLASRPALVRRVDNLRAWLRRSS